jgi:hypothetical protein
MWAVQVELLSFQYYEKAHGFLLLVGMCSLMFVAYCEAKRQEDEIEEENLTRDRLLYLGVVTSFFKVSPLFHSAPTIASLAPNQKFR